MGKVRETRTIMLGVRESVPPFSFVNAQKPPIGYLVDLCMNVVEEIKRELELPDIKIQFKLVVGPERIPKPIAGDINLQCGSTTNRHGLIANAMVTTGDGHAEREAAKVMINAACEAADDDTIGIALDTDKGYDAQEFIRGCQDMGVIAHVAQKPFQLHRQTASNTGE